MKKLEQQRIFIRCCFLLFGIGVAELCNLSEGIEKRGEARGIAIGEEHGKKDILLSLIKSGLDPKYLANSTGIPLKKINELIQAASHLPGNVNISFRNAEGEMLLHRLDLKGICVSTGSACDSVNTQISHVLKAIHVPLEYAEGTIRVTFGADNTVADAIEIANALKNIFNHN